MSRGKNLIFLYDYRRETDEIIVDCCDKFTLGYIRTWLLENYNKIDYKIHKIGIFYGDYWLASTLKRIHKDFSGILYEDYYLTSSLKRIRKDFLINNTDIVEIEDYYNNENNDLDKLPVIKLYINLTNLKKKNFKSYIDFLAKFDQFLCNLTELNYSIGSVEGLGSIISFKKFISISTTSISSEVILTLQPKHPCLDI